MTKKPINDPFAAIRKARTAAPNYGLDTAAIIQRLTKWQSLCSFRVASAEGDAVDIRFATLPKDMDGFVRDLYEFCPDLVDQGTGVLGEMIAAVPRKDLTPKMKKLVQGVDFGDEGHGLEILKRQLQQERKVSLWWD